MTAYSAKAPGPPAGEPMTRCPVLDDLAAQLHARACTAAAAAPGTCPWAMRMSGKFSAAARTLTRTCPSPGVGTGTSSRVIAGIAELVHPPCAHGPTLGAGQASPSTRSTWRWPTVS